MLHIVLLDCALELMPREISSLKQIQQHASRRKKKPSEILLDQTYHGQSMTRLAQSERRGRPDIAFLSLLSILETPLCKEGILDVHLHLQDGQVVSVQNDVRLPRNYDRFVGLLEQLLLKKQVPPQGTPLLRITQETLEDLILRLKAGPNKAITLLAIEGGKQTTIEGFRSLLPEDPAVPVIVGIGAFPHGTLSEEIVSLFDTHLELDREVMMAWHVCAEIIWTYSARVKAIENRYM